MRGLAEPYSVLRWTLENWRLTGHWFWSSRLAALWRRHGQYRSLPGSESSVPFPTLEAELPGGSWVPVPCDVGAPAGKTKTILIDLEKNCQRALVVCALRRGLKYIWDSRLFAKRLALTKTSQTLWRLTAPICVGTVLASLSRCLISFPSRSI